MKIPQAARFFKRHLIHSLCDFPRVGFLRVAHGEIPQAAPLHRVPRDAVEDAVMTPAVFPIPAGYR